MAVSPPALDFGEVVEDVETRELQVFVTNSGLDELNVDLSLTGDPGFAIVGETTFEVAIDGSLTIPVQFAPTELGDFTGELVLSTDDPDNGGLFTVPLSGIGRVPYAPDIELWDEFGNPSSVLDFGQVDEDTQRGFQIANVGDDVLEFGSVVQAGAGTFSLFTPDPSGAKIAPGQFIVVLVHYDFGLTDGDSGTIRIPSNDPDEEVVEVELEANGGGTEPYPVAIIDCPEVVDLEGSVPVLLDGSASTEPTGGELTYAWSLVRLPDGVDPSRAMSPLDQASTTLIVDAVGEWEVSLTVTSVETTRSSVPAKCVLASQSIDDIHVELSWAGPTSDLDLHLALEDAVLFDVPGDTSWCNTQPDWGASGNPDDDGHLELDDDEGYGPEHVGVNSPVDGKYYVVRVHHYDDGDDDDVTATVSVFTNNELQWSGSQVLARNEVWDVGQVNWPDGTFGEYTTEPWDAEGVRECR